MKTIFKGVNDDGMYLIITSANTLNSDFIITVCNDNNNESMSIRLDAESVINLKSTIESEIPF